MSRPLAAAAVALFALSAAGCGSKDYSGTITLHVVGTRDAKSDVYVGVQLNGGQTCHIKLPARGGCDRIISVQNTASGTNSLVLSIWSDEKPMTQLATQTLSFNALPGEVVRVDVTTGQTFTFTGKCSTEKPGTHPDVIADEAKKKAKEEELERERKEKEAAAVATEMRKFATDYVPGLQKAIDKHDEVIRKSGQKLDEFAREMAKQNVDPKTRPPYIKLSESLERMKATRDKLEATRKETFIQWKELKLLGDTGDTQKELDELLKKALDEADTATKRLESETT